MSNYAVLLVGANDIQGRPQGSLADVQILKDGQTCQANRVEMTEAQVTALRGSFDAQTSALMEATKLARVKDATKKRLKQEITFFIGQRYNDAQQRTLMMLYQEAQALGFTNRQTMIQTAVAWIKDTLSAYYAKRDEVMAATTTEAAEAVSFDLSALSAANPAVAIEDVLAVDD